MFELYKAECRRFRWWALGGGAVHAVLLLFFDRVLDPLQQPLTVYKLIAAIYTAAGLLLGLYQAGSYARINHWVALLHRPLSPYRILLSITGAGATILVAVVLVPLILLLITHGAMAARFVDARHWLLMISGGLIALIGFLAGSYVVLSPRRYGWLALALPLLLTKSVAVGAAALVVQAVILAALVLLVASVFKPDLERPPRGRIGLAGTALVIAIGACWILIFGGDFAFQTAWILTGTHPLNSIPPKGGIVEATRAEGADLFDAALAHRNDAPARVWREQVRMSQVFELPVAAQWLPVRGELTNDRPLEFDDERRGIHWTFSHDAMAFRGVRLADNRPAGLLDVDGGFAAPPLPVGDDRFLAGDSLIVFNPDDGTLHRRLRLGVGEVVVGQPTRVGDAVAVLGNRALHFFDQRDLDADDAHHPPLAVVPLPGPVGDLGRIHVIELLNGYLVSFTYGRDSIDGPAAAWQRIVMVDGDGHSRTVVERALEPDFPLTLRFADYVVSPALQAARELVDRASGGNTAVAEAAPIQVPGNIWMQAGILSLIAGLCAAWLAWRRGLGRLAGLIWTAASLVIGLPMLIAFWLIRPRARA